MDRRKAEMLAAIGRGSGKSSMEYQLSEAMIRADVYKFDNFRDRTTHFVSMNKDAPLTEEEKQNISNYLGLHMYPFEIVFDN
jgi:hypothetical protein